jgi:hypothetical protein
MGMSSRIFPVVLVLFLAVAPLADIAMSGEGTAAGRSGAPLRVKTEWESPVFNGSATILQNDTDRDGIMELIVWGEFQTQQGSSVNSVTVYKPPSYEIAWTANFSGWVSDVSLADLYRNGSVEIIIKQEDFEGTNFTVVSGAGFSTLWEGPTIGGNVYYNLIEDVDADGELEFVWVNTTSTFNGTAFGYESYVQVYGARSHQKEWTSPAIPQQISEFDAVQLDSDAALELFLMSYSLDENWSTVNQTINVYDGASHSLLWTQRPESEVNALSVIYLGDADNDTRGEAILQADGDNSSAVLMYAGGNGTLLWNCTLGNSTDMATVADIDSDGALELLATGSEDIDPGNSTYNLTHYVFDIKSRSLAWMVGPLLSDQNGGSALFPLFAVAGIFPDIQPIAVPQFVLGNITIGIMTTTVKYDIIDGKTFSRLWRSPEYASMGFGGLDILASQADSDPSLELIISESWFNLQMDFKGKVHILSDSSFTEEWTSDELSGFVMAVGADVVNDSRPEIGMSIQDFDINTGSSTTQTQILDGDSHKLVWESPKDSNQQLNFSDIYGSGRNEIIYIGMTDDPDRSTSSTLSVYNDTTLKQAWSSGVRAGREQMIFIGDIDNDTLGELVTSLEWEDENYTTFSNVTVRELTEKAPPLPDIVVADGDISISNSTPVAGMPLCLTVTVRNIGVLNSTGCCVTLLVDGQQAQETTLDVARGNFTKFYFNWTALAGNHSFKVSADPLGLIEESNETNNNASLSISVRERPHPVPVISSPKQGDVIPIGANITFNGTESLFSPGGTRSFYWNYDGQWYLGNSSKFNAIMPAGPHRVTLHADDGFFNASTSVNVTVGHPKPPPGTTWAVISSPDDGADFLAGEKIRFDGSESQAARAEYTLSHDWSSNRTGPLGVAANFTRALPAGAHNITLKVEDGHGGASSAWVHIRVLPSTGVVAIISSPVEGRNFDVSASITFDGSRSSGPAGTVLSYLWTSSLTGGLGSEKTLSRKLGTGNHTIILKVGDGQGHSASDSVNISVTGIEDFPPSVSISHPAEGASLSGVVNITGTATDETDVVMVQLRIDDGVWVRANGTHAWTFSWDTTLVANGTHRITVRADDGNQTSPEASINVTVDNRPPVPPPKIRTDDGLTALILVAVGAMFIVVAVVAAALFMRSRNRQQQPPAIVVEDESRGPAPPRM